MLKSVLNKVLKKKVSPFMTIVGIIVLELIFGWVWTGFRILGLSVLAGGVFMAQWRFKGEFSLSQLGEVFSDEVKPKESENT